MSETTKKRKNDLILLFGILVLSAVVWCIIYFFVQKDGQNVIITIDGKEYGTYFLQEDQVIVLQDHEWTNTIEIKNGKVSMTEADCPDQICVNHYAIHKTGDTIVCLPHKVVISVVSKENDGNADYEPGEEVLDGVSK